MAKKQQIILLHGDSKLVENNGLLVNGEVAVYNAAKAEGATAVTLTEAYAGKLLEVTGYVVDSNGVPYSEKSIFSFAFHLAQASFIYCITCNANGVASGSVCDLPVI